MVYLLSKWSRVTTESIDDGGGVVRCFCWSPRVNSENIEHLHRENTGFLLVSCRIVEPLIGWKCYIFDLCSPRIQGMAENCKLQNWTAYWHEIAIRESHFDAKISPKKSQPEKSWFISQEFVGFVRPLLSASHWFWWYLNVNICSQKATDRHFKCKCKLRMETWISANFLANFHSLLVISFHSVQNLH